MKKTYTVEALTPIFSYGANQTEPEIRAASIRGQLHQWFRLMGGSFESERQIFGGISIRESKSPTRTELNDNASRVIIRVRLITKKPTIQKYPTLPHKTGGRSAAKQAFAPGTQFEIHISDRLNPLTPKEWEQLDLATNAWLLLGGFGTRATRGGGSLQCLNEDWGQSLEQWKSQLHPILAKQPNFKISVHPQSYNSAEAARKVITDTIGGPFMPKDAQPLSAQNFPLGVVKGKGMPHHTPNRKTSPLKLTVRRLDGVFRIIGIWDQRGDVTGNTDQNRIALKKMLQSAGKEISHIIPSQ